MKMSIHGITGLTCLLGALASVAETAYYSLDQVRLDDGTTIDGFVMWTYSPGDFENGVNRFVYLDIPHSEHNQDDLIAAIEPAQIEITFDGNLHDDGVDIKIVLLEPLTPLTSSLIDTNMTASKYSIGGNGFNDGFFLGGRVVPTNLTVNITTNLPGLVSIDWTPELPDIAVLQETPNLFSNWTDAAESITPVTVPAAENTMFYRVVVP
ncbi:hypothetical protein [Pontiella agarivorans]|uniref:Uncharacterized protein n=1 Tax=Pontiella agarivorans TaxID=3038953 RepID=A0ABU5MVH9_9BACT|nr:hypothetical protein [Pontiella agarivorans]MDZ8118224.1 hypothetical protein [Pontiella agarivorans]